MLQNIKSLYYFNKKLFTLIEEGKKLELIKYNKNLQKEIEFNEMKNKSELVEKIITMFKNISINS